MKRTLCLAIVLAVALSVTLAPEKSLSEDEGTLLLARAMYALGKDQSYETLLALGTVAMNRVDSPWFPDTLMGVLDQPQQFPYGSRYDERTLRAAREVVSGTRSLPEGVTHYAALDATAHRDTLKAAAVVGNYGFYVDKG